MYVWFVQFISISELMLLFEQ